jgi:replicative DNA helicase
MYMSLPLECFDEKCRIILKDFEQYFKKFPEHIAVDKDAFDTMFFGFLHPTLNDELKTYYRKLLLGVYVDVDDDTRRGIVEQILELEFATKAANIVQKFQGGDDIDIARSIEELTETHKLQLERKVKLPWVQDDICDLLMEDENHIGLRWRLECLNHAMRPLKPGDFGVIAARPDVGKTSFLTSELTFMAPQLAKLYPNEKRPILWCNNEGPGKRIVTRLYQSALNAGIKDLISLKNAGTIVTDYAKAVGAVDNIRILDIHEMWNYEVVDILHEMNPGLIVFDMIDNIKFGGMNAGARTDQVLESMYQWARVLGVRFECPVLATSQISNEGDGEAHPTLGMLKDSKTGKQGASDFQLMIGKIHDPSMSMSRWMNLPKNKLHQEGFDKDPRTEVIFDALRGRFNMAANTGGIV